MKSTAARQRAPARTPPKRPRSLRQQEADFTAEGAPPPGLVSGEPPVQTDAPTSPTPPAPNKR